MQLILKILTFKKFNQILLKILVGFSVFLVLYNIDRSLSVEDFYNNSDLIQVPAIIHNLIYEKGHISDWNFSHTPFFFPDLVFSYIIGLFTSNIIINIQVYALIQTLCFIFFIAFLLKLVSLNAIKITTAILSTLTIFLFSSELTNKNYLELLPPMFQTANHFGATLMVIVGLYIYVQACIHKKNHLFALFFIITAFAIFSDALVAFYLTVPLIVTLAVCRSLNFISLRKVIKLIILLLMTIVTGYLLYKYFPLGYEREKSFINYHHGSITSFINVMTYFFQKSTGIAMLWLGFIFFAPLSLVKTYRFESRTPHSEVKWVDFIILWLVMIVLWTVPAFIIMDNNLLLALHGKYLGMRHLQPFIIMPVFIGLPLLLYKHTNFYDLLSKNSTSTICFFLLIIVSSINSVSSIKKRSLSTYYPQHIACFDIQAKKLNLHGGLSNYWQARPFSIYNHSGVQVVQVDGHLEPVFALNSRTQYRTIPQYDFIIVKSPTFAFDKTFILSRLGKPTSQFTCPGNYEFYVYTNGSMKNILPSSFYSG
jgi:hypothetical protein